MLTLWNGFGRDLNNEFRQMDRMLDDMWRVPRRTASATFPRVDVEETPEALVLHADVPGMTADDVRITLHEGVLVLESDGPTRAAKPREGARNDPQAGARRATNEEGGFAKDGQTKENTKEGEVEPRYLVRERQALTFKRTFKLGRDLDPEAVTASVKDGVLRVTLPKRPQVQPREIPIKTT